MEYIQSIILGVIQGLTEFLPVSSSGHLIITHDLLGFGFVDSLSFDVALHIGTLVALVLFFWKEMIAYIVAFFRSLANWNLRNDLHQRLSWFILVGSIPAGLVGFVLESMIEEKLRDPWLVALMLIGVGVLFLVFERIFSKRKELEALGWPGAIIIGCAQALALMPGVSRSGITILAGLSQGLKREAAARFSFLLSIPVVFGAGVKKILDAYEENLSVNEWLTLLVGAIIATFVGYLVIKFLLRYLSAH
jgi:undecaprenyl-diphosphatase